jgi:hypothetical protein
MRTWFITGSESPHSLTLDVPLYSLPRNFACTTTRTSYCRVHATALNLWRIALNLSNVTLTPAPALHQYDDSALPVLLMHDNTRPNVDYVRYTHSCLENPASTTFLQAVQRGYITGPNQFPRLTTTMVRRNMPDSEATARGHEGCY